MADRKSPIASGNAESDREEEKRLREREEKGLEPEQQPGPRPLEGISSAGRLYASQEEADRDSPSGTDARRPDVDEEAARVLGDGNDS